MWGFGLWVSGCGVSGFSCRVLGRCCRRSRPRGGRPRSSTPDTTTPPEKWSRVTSPSLPHSFRFQCLGVSGFGVSGFRGFGSRSFGVQGVGFRVSRCRVSGFEVLSVEKICCSAKQGLGRPPTFVYIPHDSGKVEPGNPYTIPPESRKSLCDASGQWNPDACTLNPEPWTLDPQP